MYSFVIYSHIFRITTKGNTVISGLRIPVYRGIDRKDMLQTLVISGLRIPNYDRILWLFQLQTLVVSGLRIPRCRQKKRGKEVIDPDYFRVAYTVFVARLFRSIVIDPGYFQVAYTYSSIALLMVMVIDHGYFQVAYTPYESHIFFSRLQTMVISRLRIPGFRKPVSIIKFNTVFALCLYGETKKTQLSKSSTLQNMCT